jgi:hypothetical protein
MNLEVVADGFEQELLERIQIAEEVESRAILQLLDGDSQFIERFGYGMCVGNDGCALIL